MRLKLESNLDAGGMIKTMPPVHLVLDEEDLARHKRADQTWAIVEKTRSYTAEAIQNQQKAIASDNGVPTTSLEAQIGKPLLSTDVINRLNKLSPSLHFEVSHADERFYGVYHVQRGVKRHICAMLKGWMSEWGVREIDERGECTGVIPGWRTVAARLIRARIVTIQQIEQSFGIPSRDSESWWKLTVV
jgi:hypothetical protein